MEEERRGEEEGVEGQLEEGCSAKEADPPEEVLEEEAPPDVVPSRRWTIPARWRRRAGLAAAVVAVGLALWTLYTWITWPDVASLRAENPASTAFIERYRESRRGEARPGDVAWQPVPYDRISSNLKRAVVASEDTEFFFHEGFSSHELRESLKKAIREREAPRGASTITQQLAKNLWLTPRRSLTRKLREALLTKQLERELSKQRILELYLNVVEFGPGIYGAEAAARHYFGVSAADLSPRQAAMLAAGLPRPRTWNPSSASEAYARNTDRILHVSRQLRFLDRYFGAEQPGVISVAPPAVEISPSPDAGSADSARNGAPDSPNE